jgi:DNA modification methylase
MASSGRRSGILRGIALPSGSGTVGEACEDLKRNYVLVDCNPEAVTVMKKRLARFEPEVAEIDRRTFAK